MDTTVCRSDCTSIYLEREEFSVLSSHWNGLYQRVSICLL